MLFCRTALVIHATCSGFVLEHIQYVFMHTILLIATHFIEREPHLTYLKCNI